VGYAELAPFTLEAVSGLTACVEAAAVGYVDCLVVAGAADAMLDGAWPATE